MITRPPLWMKCPACQRVSALLNLGLSRSQPNYECEECGHTWEVPRPDPPPVRPKNR